MATETEFLAGKIKSKLQGESSDQKSEKIASKIIAIFNSQISALQSKKIDKESELEEAREAFDDVIYVTDLPKDSKLYCESLVLATEKISLAEEELKNVTDSIDYFKKLLSKVKGDKEK